MLTVCCKEKQKGKHLAKSALEEIQKDYLNLVIHIMYNIIRKTGLAQWLMHLC